MKRGICGFCLFTGRNCGDEPQSKNAWVNIKCFLHLVHPFSPFRGAFGSTRYFALCGERPAHARWSGVRFLKKAEEKQILSKSLKCFNNFFLALFWSSFLQKLAGWRGRAPHLFLQGNPPLVRFPSFRLRRKFTLRWRFGRIKEFRPLRRATADRGGSDKPLKRLERNFQTDNAVTHR